MINLHTGLPGNGKTLYTLSTVEKRRIKENRAVYYHNIKEVTLDGWTALTDDEAAKWYELPAGAIIVLDEAQRLFPPRPNGAPIPKAESQLQTHRHNGHDLYIISQDPTMLPAHLRKLCNTHRHMMRKFGSKWVTVHQFEGVRDNVAKSRKDSIESQWVDDVSMYGKYKSAEVITQKFRVPFKLLLAACLPFVIIGAAWYFYQKRLAGNPTPPVPATAGPMVGNGATTGKGQEKRVYDLAAFEPRLPGLPHTAPRYDELTAPVRVPSIVGCVMAASGKAQCYSQQGTKISPPKDFIVQYLENGMFEDYERGPEIGSMQAAKNAGSGSKPEQLAPIGRANQNAVAVPSDHLQPATSAAYLERPLLSAVRDGENIRNLRKASPAS